MKSEDLLFYIPVFGPRILCGPQLVQNINGGVRRETVEPPEQQRTVQIFKKQSTDVFYVPAVQQLFLFPLDFSVCFLRFLFRFALC